MIRGVHTMFYTSEPEALHVVESGTPHISFYCDDLDASMAELRRRGAEFVEDVADVGYGRRFLAPGDFTIELYEPTYRKR